MKPRHIVTKQECIYSNDRMLLHLSTVFVDGLDSPLFHIDYCRLVDDEDCTFFTLTLTWDELEYLTRDVLEYGRCGHLTTWACPNDCFVVRNEFGLVHGQHGGNYMSPPLKVNGMVRMRLKRTVNYVFNDVVHARVYIKHGSQTVTVVCEDDATFTEKLIQGYVYSTYQWLRQNEGGDINVDSIVKGITVEKLNDFLEPSKLRFHSGKHLQPLSLKILNERGSKHLTSYANIAPISMFVAHMYRCHGECTNWQK